MVAIGGACLSLLGSCLAIVLITCREIYPCLPTLHPCAALPTLLGAAPPHAVPFARSARCLRRAGCVLVLLLRRASMTTRLWCTATASELRWVQPGFGLPSRRPPLAPLPAVCAVICRCVQACTSVCVYTRVCGAHAGVRESCVYVCAYLCTRPRICLHPPLDFQLQAYPPYPLHLPTQPLLVDCLRLLSHRSDHRHSHEQRPDIVFQVVSQAAMHPLPFTKRMYPHAPSQSRVGLLDAVRVRVCNRGLGSESRVSV